MLAGSPMEVFARLLRLASIIASLFVIAGLIGFLIDEVRNTSVAQATRIPDPGSGRIVSSTADLTEPDPPAAIEQLRADNHTKAREAIDDVGDLLMSPFGFLIEGSQPWVKRLLYSALALILYGVIGLVLADVIRKQADSARRAAMTAAEKAAAEERKRTGTYMSPS